jgi:hypothetical protein
MKKRLREQKADRQARQEQIPYELVEKEVCGQRVPVKVYRPAWEQGDPDAAFQLKENPFSRDRGDGLKRKCGREKK